VEPDSIIDCTAVVAAPSLRNAAPFFTVADAERRADLDVVVRMNWFHASVSLRSGADVTIRGDGLQTLQQIADRAAQIDVRRTAFITTAREHGRYITVTLDDIGYMIARHPELYVPELPPMART